MKPRMFVALVAPWSSCAHPVVSTSPFLRTAVFRPAITGTWVDDGGGRLSVAFYEKLVGGAPSAGGSGYLIAYESSHEGGASSEHVYFSARLEELDARRYLADLRPWRGTLRQLDGDRRELDRDTIRFRGRTVFHAGRVPSGLTGRLERDLHMPVVVRLEGERLLIDVIDASSLLNQGTGGIPGLVVAHADNLLLLGVRQPTSMSQNRPRRTLLNEDAGATTDVNGLMILEQLRSYVRRLAQQATLEPIGRFRLAP
jgi:hypothetical protein